MRCELSSLVRIEWLAGKNVDVYRLHQVKGVHNDRAGEDELNGAGALGFRISLLICRSYVNVIPKVQVAALHIDQVAKLIEKCLNAASREKGGVTVVKVQNQLDPVVWSWSPQCCC